MNVLICRTCGCSLVRLGVSKEQAVPYNYDGKEYFFCCQGCVDLFITDSQKYMQETDDLIVCPSCLAEKPRQYAAKLEHEGREVYFCRCPYCTVRPVSRKQIIICSLFDEFWNSWKGFYYVEECMTVNRIVEDLATP